MIVHEFRRDGGEGEMIAWLSERPSYCDRGRWTQGIEVGFWKSENDSNIRYYFDLTRGQAETEAYLLAKRIDISGCIWVEKDL